MINTYINLLVTQPYYGAQMARYLITLDQGVHASKAAATSAITAAGASVVKEYSFSLTFEIEATAEQLANISGTVEYIEKDSTTSITVQVVNQDHLSQLAQTSVDNTFAYNPTNKGAGGHVYLVDTGVYADHEQFVGRIINNLYSNFSNDFSDTVGHGTAVASLIIGNTQGVSIDATLHNVKLFDNANGDITIGEIIDALDEVLAHHLGSNPSQVKVVCLPWVTAQNNFLDNKILELNSSNLVVVAAAGNNGQDINNYSPAGVNTVLTVGAMDTDFNVQPFTNVPWTDPAVSYFNNYGASLDIFAPGVDISCAGIASSNDYTTLSGTSLSAGIVAGAAVQWINTYPNKPSSEIKDVILQEGHIRGMSLLTFDQNHPIATSDVYRSVITVGLVGQSSISNLPSGRILNVQLGQTATKDLELNLASAVDFSVLNFAPLPPWATIDFTTGILSVDATSLAANLAPGIYLFGIKATVNGKVLVEEFSVGLYASSVSELDEATQFYYDSDTDSYDQVVAYNVAASQKN